MNSKPALDKPKTPQSPKTPCKGAPIFRNSYTKNTSIPISHYTICYIIFHFTILYYTLLYLTILDYVFHTLRYFTILYYTLLNKNNPNLDRLARRRIPDTAPRRLVEAPPAALPASSAASKGLTCTVCFRGCLLTAILE